MRCRRLALSSEQCFWELQGERATVNSTGNFVVAFLFTSCAHFYFFFVGNSTGSPHRWQRLSRQWAWWWFILVSETEPAFNETFLKIATDNLPRYLF